MTLSIEEIIEERPHLEDSFRMYEKVLKFTNEVRGLLPPMSPGPGHQGMNAYPRSILTPVFEQFSSLFDLPEGSLSPLKEAMEVGDIDFTRLPLREVPSFSLPYPEEELTMLLFLLSKPYFLQLGDARRTDSSSWENGKCPVCGASPVLSLTSEDEQRKLFCSFCGTAGHYRHIGCPACTNDDPARITIIEIEDEEDFRVDACDACGSYLKTVDEEALIDMTPDVADLISLPLDFAAQERKYVRLSPNPLGLIRMI